MKPLYKLTKKKVKFVWEKKQQEAFETVKDLLQKAPILTMPRCYGKLCLYSDTSKIAKGGALYQLQEGEEQLLGYYSKRLEESCKSYSITELEMK